MMFSSGTCEADYDCNLDGFMLRCQQKVIQLNAEKLEYKCKEVPFHGHLLTTEGLKPDPEKVRTRKTRLKRSRT